LEGAAFSSGHRVEGMFNVSKSSINPALFGGFVFGMMLQLSIGPVCLYVFETGFARGFISAETAVLAVAIIDALYIVLAIGGIATLISGKKSRLALKIIGAIVIIIFGLNIIMTQYLKVSLFPATPLFSGIIFDHPFWDALLLTASNPLTIIFWSGVFATKVSENDFSKQDLVYFSIGCLIASLVFLTLVAFAGSLIQNFLPSWVIQVLNVAVGAFLIYFAGKMLLSRKA
jgi:threonine/homoserine/homoserine lactone efflux protein